MSQLSTGPVTGAGLHPDELPLHAYLDGELPAEAGEGLAVHLAHCPVCRARAHIWSELGAAVRAAQPDAELFSGEGEFWARLASRVPAVRPATWPALAYLPPVVLGLLGTVVNALISAAFVLYALAGLGVLPPTAAAVRSALPGVLVDPLLEGSLAAWLGWSAREAIAGTLSGWEVAGGLSQDTALFGAALLALSVLLAIVVVLYVFWAFCWSRGSSESR